MPGPAQFKSFKTTNILMQKTGGPKSSRTNLPAKPSSKLKKQEPKLERQSKTDCLAGLLIDPKSKTAKMLEPPKDLFLVNGGAEPSFSSNPEKTLDALALVFARRGKEKWNQEVPQDVLAALPDYGLDLRGDGNQAYLLLVDKRRKIIVRAQVLNLWSGKTGPELGRFEAALKEALSLAQKGMSQNREFEFVFVDGSRIPSLFTKDSASILS